MKLFKKHKWIINLILFLATIVTTLIAGMGWITGKMELFYWFEYYQAIPYTIGIISILLFHEFGHYIAAKIHKVDVSLPYFIPLLPFSNFWNFGTMGAVIKTKSEIPNSKALFDIGISGPLSGFIACIVILIIGFKTLPGPEYILKIYPDYFDYSYSINKMHLEFGDTILFAILRYFFTDSNQFVPPMSIISHYPLLNVGWFGLFVTSMNMMPVGQLDGGHITYAIFGIKKHRKVANATLLIILSLGIFGLIDNILTLNFGFGWIGWILWSFLLRFFIKTQHPEISNYTELNLTRKILGYISYVILILSFTPSPFIVVLN